MSFYSQSDKIFKILMLAAIVVGSFSCHSTRRLSSDQYLLDKNIIKVEPKSLKSELENIIKQKPNTKMLGVFRFHLIVYNLGASGKVDSAGNYKKFNRWLMNTVGEEPVILDTFLVAKSSKQLSQYMQNIGYFNAVVKDSVVYKRRHKSYVYYTVKSNSPYLINQFSYNIPDTAIRNFVLKDSTSCVLKTGNNYKTVDIQKERERITKMLRNEGYYNFSQQYIHFDIDSSLNNNRVNIKMNIDNPSFESTDTIESSLYHQQFKIHKIYVVPDYDLLAKDENYSDRDTIDQIGIDFLEKKNIRYQFKPGIIEQHIFLSSEELFRQKNIDLTYRRLQDLGTFRFVNIKMSPASRTSTADSILANYLDCYINLTPTKMQDYSIENELTTSGGNVGLAGSISYRHKNIFRGTQMLEIKLRGSLETQADFITETENQPQTRQYFRSYDLGIETNLSFHKFLLPFKISQNEKTFEPVTRISASFGLENRIEYDRTTTRFSLAYVFKSSPKVRQYIYPAELNFVDVTLTPEYEQQINELNDASVIASYSDHMIGFGKYSLVYSDQYVGRIKNVLFLRFNSELAGNLFYAIDKLNPNKTVSPETGSYQRFNVDYAQYFRPDVDFRYYQLFNEHHQLVYRLNGGIGIPYLNTDFILFEKSFFAGGSSDNRAFSPYKLGPGGEVPENSIQQFGTIKIAFNLEYRFDMLKILQGALFVDGGNVWIQNPDPQRPLADININRFYKEMAIGAGAGLRFNFTFFIFRLDAAVPVTYPAYPVGERYVLNDFNQFNDINFNFGIGYPF